MSKLSRADVEHVARLAQLHLKHGEIEKFKDQLSKIFEYVDQIGEMKTKGVKETSQVAETTNRTRPDKIRRETMLSQEEALENAKRKHKGYFVVKAVFEE